ncbi:MAG TPA: extracellular solute-binding protein [Trueperaceae bacterium]|nr:extracellular solute-binding protein [Trueperaceae bacterium]
MSTLGRFASRALVAGAVILTLLGTSASAQKPTLLIANWQGYGSDLPWVVQAFESQCDCTVKQVDFSSEQQLLNMLHQGGVGRIDAALPNSTYIRYAIDDGLLQPIDVSKLANYHELIPGLTSLDALHQGGKVYGVPWLWGTVGIGYDPNSVKAPVTGYAALWDKQYAGKATFNDDPVIAVMTAALYLGEDPYHPDLAKVKQALLDQKRLDVTYWATTDDFTKLYTSKQVVVGNVWSGLATQIKANGYPIDYVTPKDVVTWVDNWVIVKNAPHPQLAYQWIDFMISQQFQDRYARDLKQQPPSPANQVVAQNLPADMQQTFQPGAVLETGISQATYNAWAQLWTEVKTTPVKPLR